MMDFNMKNTNIEVKNELWSLRKKYYALYTTLNDKLPKSQPYFGSHDYILSMSRIASERNAYEEVLKDIDNILGV
jgi:hypothetical protein